MLRIGYLRMFRRSSVHEHYRYSNEFPGHHNIHDLDTILYMTTIARDTERKLNSYGGLVA